MLRRIGLVFTGVTLSIVLAAGPAFAFECYNANRSAQGNASAAGAPALASFFEILTDPEVVGLCPAGAEFVISEVGELGFRTDVLINFRTLMAGGLVRNGTGETKLHDGKGIDHLSEEFFAAVDPLIGQGFGICAGA